MYSQASFKDTIWTKVLVYTIYIMQTTQIILLTNNVFRGDLIDNFSITQFKIGWFSVCIIQGLGMQSPPRFSSSIICLSDRVPSDILCAIILCVAYINYIRKKDSKRLYFPSTYIINLRLVRRTSSQAGDPRR